MCVLLVLFSVLRFFPHFFFVSILLSPVLIAAVNPTHTLLKSNCSFSSVIVGVVAVAIRWTVPCMRWFWCCVVELKFNSSSEICTKKIIKSLYFGWIDLCGWNTGEVKNCLCLFTHQIVKINFRIFQKNWMMYDKRKEKKKAFCFWNDRNDDNYNLRGHFRKIVNTHPEFRLPVTSYKFRMNHNTQWRSWTNARAHTRRTQTVMHIKYEMNIKAPRLIVSYVLFQIPWNRNEQNQKFKNVFAMQNEIALCIKINKHYIHERYRFAEIMWIATAFVSLRLKWW